MNVELQDQKELTALVALLSKESCKLATMISTPRELEDLWAAKSAFRLLVPDASWKNPTGTIPTLPEVQHKLRESAGYIRDYIKLSILKLRAEKL